MRDLEHYDIEKVMKRGYVKSPVAFCHSCGGEIFLGEEYITDGYYSFHNDCLFVREAGRR